MDAVTNVPPPHNEPVRQYPPGSPDRAVLEGKLKELAGERAELTMTIGGRQRLAARAAEHERGQRAARGHGGGKARQTERRWPRRPGRA